MDPINDQHSILRQLRELNALLANHIEKTKKDVQQLESKLQKKKATISSLPIPAMAGIRQLASQWQEQLN
jgi:ferritin-like metal-binding protein YciE